MCFIQTLQKMSTTINNNTELKKSEKEEID